MALEGVLARLRGLARVEPLDGDAALDARGGVAFVGGHARRGAEGQLQARLAPLPGLDGEHVGGCGDGVGGEAREGAEVVDEEGARGHGDDEFGRGFGEGEDFGGERDGGGIVGLLVGVLDVEGAVPGAGDEHGVLGGVGDGFDGFGVRTQDGLLAGGEIDSATNARQLVIALERGKAPLPPDVHVEASGEGFIVVSAEANVEDRGTMFKFLYQLASRGS